MLPILALLATTGGLINAVQTTMYALGAHVYPAAIRATGVGSAASFGRVGAVVSGYAGALALEHGGSMTFFIVMAAAMAVCGIALASIQRHVRATLQKASTASPQISFAVRATSSSFCR